jgi:hypothetical protein
MMLLLVSFITPGIASAARNQDPPKTENVKTLPDGTEFTVVTVDEITSKTAAEGDPLTFKVAEDVKVDGQTVIAKDTDRERLSRAGEKGRDDGTRWISRHPRRVYDDG